MKHSIVGLWLMIILIFILAASPASVPVQEQGKRESGPPGSPTPPPSTHLTDAQRAEHFLRAIINGLITRGFLSSEPISSLAELWQQDLSAILPALDAYSPIQGGYLSDTELSLPGADASVMPNPSGTNLRLILPQGGAQSALGPRRGLLPEWCVPSEITPASSHITARIQRNLECLFALQVREYLLSQGGEIDEETVELSGVSTDLTSYLETLKAAGIVASYVIDLPAAELRFELQAKFPLPRIGSAALDAFLLVNPYASADEEAQSLASDYNSLLAERYYLYLLSGQVPPLEVVSHTRLEAALEAVLELSSDSTPEQRRNAFLSVYGVGDLSLPPNPTPTPDPNKQGRLPEPDCEYTDGIETPCNREILHLVGPDRVNFTRYANGQNLLSSIADTLVAMRYRRVKKNLSAFRIGSASPPALSQWEDGLVEALRNSQTILIDAHGSPNGSSTVLCYDAITYGHKCCEKMTELAGKLGMDTSTSECSPSRFSVQIDENSGAPALPAIHISSHTAMRCDQTREDDMMIEHGRCVVRLGPGLFRHLGSKAALLTSQCYGGGGAGYDGFGSIADAFGVGSHRVTRQVVARHDTQLLKMDLTAYNQVVMKCLDSAPESISEPYCISSENCQVPAKDSCYALLGEGYQTIEGSVESRGVLDHENPGACSNVPNPDTGFMQYCRFTEHGIEDVAIEFKPRVQGAEYSTATGLVTINFSSDVVPDESAVDVVLHGGPPRLNRQVWQVLSFSPKALQLQLDAELISLMPNGFWLLSDQELRKRYGHDKTDWPFYVEVKLTGLRAPNGIKLAGNNSAQRKWIWPDVGPEDSHYPRWYKNLNGVFPAGGSTFRVWLPRLPQFTCCKPWYLVKACVKPGGAGDTACFKSHETCNSINSLAECFTEIDPQAGINCGRFEGDIHKNWYEPCGPEITGCEAYTGPPDSLRAQYKAWPLDETEPGQCAPPNTIEVTPPCPTPFPTPAWAPPVPTVMLPPSPVPATPPIV